MFTTMVSNLGVKMDDLYIEKEVQISENNKFLADAHVENCDHYVLNCDNKSLTSLAGLNIPESTEQFSAAFNNLPDLAGVSHLRNLTVLNLSNNEITVIHGLRSLSKLVWLNLSANRIQTIENLNHNINLQHIDLSDNSICSLGDLRGLTKLKILLLHGNRIESLAQAKTMLPWNINTLSLASNDIADLNEISYLSHLTKLHQLSIMGNPCVSTSANCMFDYRPFVVNWCIKVRILDGVPISEREGLKAEWLFSQGKGRRFSIGHHSQLIQYLSSVCSSDHGAQVDSNEDIRLSTVLKKQRLYQQQQHQQQQQQQSLLHGHSGGSSVVTEIVSSAHSKAYESMEIEDISSEDENPVMLASDSRYLPVLAEPANTGGDEIISKPVETSSSSIDISSGRLGTSSSRRIAANFSSLPHDSPPTVARKFSAATDAAQVAPTKSSHLSSSSVPNNDTYHSDVATSRDDVSTSSARIDLNQSTDSSKSIPSHVELVNKAAPLRLDAAPKAALLQHQRVGETAATVKALPHQGDVGKSSSSKSSRPTPRGQTQSPIGRNDKSDHHHGANAGNLLKGVIRRRDNDTGQLVATSSALYTPEKYRNTMRQIFGENRNDDDGSLSSAADKNGAGSDRSMHAAVNRYRKHVDHNERTRAATIIQALWRGYMARHKNRQVLASRSELRTRRLEDHIRFLRLEVTRQTRLYEQEKQLRLFYVEALKRLHSEIKELQEWKSQVSTSMDQSTLSLHQSLSSPTMSDSVKSTSTVECTEQLLDILQKACSDGEPCLQSSASPLYPHSSHVFHFNTLQSQTVEHSQSHPDITATKDSVALGLHHQRSSQSTAGDAVVGLDNAIKPSSRSFPSRQSIGSDSGGVVTSNTYPLIARKSAEVLTTCHSPVFIGENPDIKPHNHGSVSGDNKTKSQYLIGSGSYDSKVKGPAKNDNGGAKNKEQQTTAISSDVRGTVDSLSSDDQVKYVPKPPADLSPLSHRNSLTRRHSMRRRRNSGSTVAEGSASTTSPESKDQFLQPAAARRESDETRSRSDKSLSPSRHPKIRSASVGSTRSSSHHAVAVAVTESSSSSAAANLKQSKDSATDRLSPSSSGAVASDKSVDTPHKSRKLFGHKRSKSDMNKVVAESSTSQSSSRQDATVPTPASSPRLWRSSSFSTGRGTNGTSPLRQAVSLEVLKAFNRSRQQSESSVPPSSGDQASTASSSAVPAAAVAAGGDLVAEQHASFSTNKQSQLGNKAANLFASLQKRIAVTNTKR